MSLTIDRLATGHAAGRFVTEGHVDVAGGRPER